MISYRGYKRGKVEHYVKRVERDDAGSIVSDTRLDHARHINDVSQTGFGWGRSGQGSAQLAVALLWDATHDKNVVTKYQYDFEQAFIYKMDIDGFVIEQSTILGFIDGMEKGERQLNEKTN